MAQPFLHRRQDGLAGFREDDPIRMQSGGGKARGKQVRLLQDPQDRPIEARQHTGCEQGRGSGMFRVRSGRDSFVQHPQA